MGRIRTAGTAGALAALLACAGPREAPGPPAAAERRYYGFLVLELRDAALNAHDLDAAANAYAVNAEVIDADSGAVVLRGREAIQAAHARFLAACPAARIEVLDRAYGDGGRVVADVERVHCRGAPPVEGRIRYEIDQGSIVRVLTRGSPPFER
jgi:hypothetical protein